MLVQFSESLETFASVSPDNRLKIWEVASGALRQEYVKPNHLAEQYTCMTWSIRSPWESKKGKKQNKREHNTGLGLIALGTKTGNIVIWDLSKGEIVQELNNKNGGHLTSVHDVEFDSHAGRLYSCSADKDVLEWDVKNGKVLRKFKCGKEGATKLAISVDDSLLAIGSTSIRIFELSSGKKSKKLSSGHSSEISCLKFSSCSKYIFSATKSSRWVNMFECGNESNEALVTFAMDSCPVSIFVTISHQSKQTICRLGCVSDNGCVYLWEHSLSQGQGKARSVAPCSKTVCSSSTKEDTGALQILDAAFCRGNESAMVVARGNSITPIFEQVEVACKGEGLKKTILMEGMCDSTFNVDSDNVAKKTKIEEDVQHQNVHVVSVTEQGSMKTSTMVDAAVAEQTTDEEDVNEPSLAERLNALREKVEAAIEDDAASVVDDGVEKTVFTDKPQASSIVTVLEQALQSKDNSMLEYCLQINDIKTINNTVKRLPSIRVIPLLNQIVEKFEKKPTRGIHFCTWIRSILLNHTSYLLTVPDVIQNLSSLYQTLQVHLKVFQQVHKLSGRLDLVIGQICKKAKQERGAEERQPTQVYNEDEEADGVENEVDDDENESENDSESDSGNNEDESEEDDSDDSN